MRDNVVAKKYGTPDGLPVEDVLRQIIDDNCGVGNADFVVPVSPGFLLLPFFLDTKQPLLVSLEAIAHTFGWTVEYTVGPAPDFRPTFTLQKPERYTVAS